MKPIFKISWVLKNVLHLFVSEIDRRHDDDDRHGLQQDAHLHQPLGAPAIATLEHVVQAHAEHDVLLDMRDVSFMDSTGIRMLIDVANESSRDGFDVSIAASVQVRRILKLTGVADLLPLTADEDDPVA